MSPLPISLRGVALCALALATGLAPAIAGRALAQSPAPATAASFAGVVSATGAAVVTIRLPAPRGAAESSDDTFAEDDPGWLLGELLPELAGERRGEAVGAGVVVDASGTMITSAHLVRLLGAFDVVTSGGVIVNAKLLALDERTDLAVLRLDPALRPYPHAPLGNSDRVTVGEWVIAIGAPYGFEATVTAGIISALSRPLGAAPHADVLQTDAVLSAGNAGGPLVNLKGEVVGIATLGGGGIGFAVASNTVRKLLIDLSEWGRVRRAWLGATLQALTVDLARGLRRADTRGVLIADVEPGGPAAAAGLRPGDILLRLDATPLGGPADLERALAASAPGRTAQLGFWRNQRSTAVRIVLGEEPPPRPTPGLGLAVRPVGPGLGVVVIEVEPRGPAERAGVRRGDVIREVDRRPVRSERDFGRLTRDPQPGVPLLVLLRRGITSRYVALTPSP